MNRTRLAAIATVIGTIVVGGVSTGVWQAGPDTTTTELRDAGVLDCPTRLVTCNWRIDDDGVEVLLDAGLAVSRGYRTLASRVKVCTGPEEVPRLSRPNDPSPCLDSNDCGGGICHSSGTCLSECPPEADAGFLRGPDGGAIGCLAMRRNVVFPPFPARAGELAALAVPDLDACDVSPDPGGALWRTAPSRCVAAPADGGTLCQRSERDGGYRYFGAGNRMERGESNGHASCVDVPCVVHAGEEP